MKSYAGADRADRGLERAEGGDQHDGDVRPLRDDARAEVETAVGAHAEVGHDGVDVAAGQHVERRRGRGAPLDHEATLPERTGQRLAEASIVVDDEHPAGAHDASLFCASSAAGGRYTVNVAPWPGSLFTAMWPPCSSTIACATASPSPVPSPAGLVV